jgi:hypothetical protein
MIQETARSAVAVNVRQPRQPDPGQPAATARTGRDRHPATARSPARHRAPTPSRSRCSCGTWTRGLATLLVDPAHTVTPGCEPALRLRIETIREHFNTSDHPPGTGSPGRTGHGNAHYAFDHGLARGTVLDTVNPNGPIDPDQYARLERELTLGRSANPTSLPTTNARSDPPWQNSLPCLAFQGRPKQAIRYPRWTTRSARRAGPRRRELSHFFAAPSCLGMNNGGGLPLVVRFDPAAFAFGLVHGGRRGEGT